eukprot:8779555-Alexandrium_andersonii.AAC.1
MQEVRPEGPASDSERATLALQEGAPAWIPQRLQPRARRDHLASAVVLGRLRRRGCCFAAPL